MFDKFGKFNSAAELNAAAAGFKAEGDQDNLYELAKENGLDKEDVDDYLEGETEELATPATAAMGRIKVHEEAKKDAGAKMAMQLICMMLRNMCAVDKAMMEAVMIADKEPGKILDGLKEGARQHKSGGMGMSCGTDKQLQGIIRAYYMEDASAFKKRIEALY